MASDVDVIEFYVRGAPQVAGSKKAFVNPKTGRAIITEDFTNNEVKRRKKGWRELVISAATAAMDGRELWDGPIGFAMHFRFARPKSHYRAGDPAKGLKANAPTYHTSPPDMTKLVRAAEDSLVDIVWHNDAQVCMQSAEKQYGTPGLFMRVWRVTTERSESEQ